MKDKIRALKDKVEAEYKQVTSESHPSLINAEQSENTEPEPPI